MGIRIRPAEIDFPPLNQFAPDAQPTLDPFKGDLLDRKEKIEVLTCLVGNVEGPCTMAVDAAWGAGKTTFLKMWARHLRQQGFPVVEFNAWETDFTDDPFVALSSEITGGLSDWKARPVGHKVAKAKLIAKDVARWVGPGGIRLASGFIPVVGTELGNVASAYAEKRLADYPQATRAIRRFKSELEELAAALWEQTEQKPLVVFIDELDRCRPSYAIELLETGKHIFGVDHIVFVLAVNRGELAKSVKVLYGEEFDAELYLKRFFDIDFRLPVPDREPFIQNTLRSVGIETYLERTENQFTKHAAGDSIEVIRTFFGHSDLNLRTVGQSIHRFGLVLSSLQREEYGYLSTLAVLAVMSTVNPSLYRSFVSGELTDDETCNAFFGQSGYGKLRFSRAGAVVESVIIAALITKDELLAPLDLLEDHLPLFVHYKQLMDLPPTAHPLGGDQQDHARDVCERVMRFYNSSAQVTELVGLDQSVRRLELLSPDLLETERNR